MGNKLLVCSLQYSPIYKSHCCALGRQAEKQGFSVAYLFSHAYEWMLPETIKNNTVFIGESSGLFSSIRDGFDYRVLQSITQALKVIEPDYIYFYNFHPFLNYHTAKFAKKKGIVYIQHVQEPYVEHKRAYRGLQQVWLRGFEYLQDRVLNLTNIAIVSSKRSWVLFRRRYPKFSGNLIIIPLMYEDLWANKDKNPERCTITFIGPPVPAKGPEIFLNIVKYCHDHKYPFEFQLVSRKKIADARYYQYPNLIIAYNQIISDEEMADYQRSSQMVLTPYLIATQSSVILTSFGCGTPTLSSNVGGLPEFVEHKKTGYLVDPGAPVEEWVKGIKYISEHLDEMSGECRNYFINNYSEENWPKYFNQLFN